MPVRALPVRLTPTHWTTGSVSDHRPRHARGPGRCDEGAGGGGFDREELDFARALQSSRARADDHRAARVGATSIEEGQLAGPFATGLGPENREDVVAFGVFSREVAREQGADDDQQEDPPRTIATRRRRGIRCHHARGVRSGEAGLVSPMSPFAAVKAGTGASPASGG